MTIEEILALPLEENAAGAATIGDYLYALLTTLWKEKHHFNGHRPWRESSWESPLEIALIKAKVVEGELDGDGYVARVNGQEVNQIIQQCIETVFAPFLSKNK